MDLTFSEKRFRVISWPGEPVPVPPVEIWPVTLSEEGFIEVWTDHPASSRLVHVPPELYLRGLHDLANADDRAVLEFVERYGTLKLTNPTVVIESAWHADRAAFVSDYEDPSPRNLSIVLAKRRDQPLAAWRDLDQRIRAHAGQTTLAAAESGTLLMREVDEDLSSHLDEFRAVAGLLRDLSRVWQCVCGLAEWGDLPSLWESPFRPPRDVAPAWPSEEEAVRLLVAALNDGLAPFHVHLQIAQTTEGHNAPWAARPHPLYSVLCLQMANHIAEEAVYRRCDNCGRLYVRQEGRAEYGQHRRVGTRYCSATCNGSAAQKRFRAKKRKEAKAWRTPPSSRAESARADGAKTSRDTVYAETAKAVRKNRPKTGSSGARKPTVRRKRASGGAV